MILHEGRTFSHTKSYTDHVPAILSQYKSALNDKSKAWAACGNSCPYELRKNKNNLMIPRVKTEIARGSFYYSFKTIYQILIMIKGKEDFVTVFVAINFTPFVGRGGHLHF